MAAEDRASTVAVIGKDQIATGIGAHADAMRYEFFQALRLIRLGFAGDAAFCNGIRVQPNLSLAFPEEDVEHIEQDADGLWWIVANFFGLYGVSSPLPTFYTEDLIDEARNGRSAMRDFLDIVHAVLYPMLFSAWEKYRLWIAIAERGDARRLEQLYALIGRMDDAADVRGDARLLRFAGMFSQFPRSALALETLVAGLLGGERVSVEPCVTRTVAIPPEAQCQLGTASACIGEVLLGDTMTQRSNTILIQVGPLDARRFNMLLPGGESYKTLLRDLAMYVHEPLHCVLELLLAPMERYPAVLGGQQWSRLGLDIWLGFDAAGEFDLNAHTLHFPSSATFELPLHACAAYVSKRGQE